MKSIFTYPNDAATSYIDPDYYGDASSGFYKRVQELKDGNYKPWDGLAPPANVDQMMDFISKFHNRIDESWGQNTFYKFHELPMVIGHTALAQDDISDATVGSLTDVVINFPSYHHFHEDVKVALSGFDGSLGELNGQEFYINNIDTDTVKLTKTTGGDPIQLYSGFSGDITSIDHANSSGQSQINVNVTSGSISNGDQITFDNVDGSWASLLNGNTYYAEVIDSSTIRVHDSAALDNELAIYHLASHNVSQAYAGDAGVSINYWNADGIANGQKVQISGFDGTIGETYNGGTYYVQNVDEGGFYSLSFDAAGEQPLTNDPLFTTDVLNYEASNGDLKFNISSSETIESGSGGVFDVPTLGDLELNDVISTLQSGSRPSIGNNNNFAKSADLKTIAITEWDNNGGFVTARIHIYEFIDSAYQNTNTITVFSQSTGTVYVSMSDDGSRLVAGRPSSNGTVYVYDRTNSSWIDGYSTTAIDDYETSTRIWPADIALSGDGNYLCVAGENITVYNFTSGVTDIFEATLAGSGLYPANTVSINSDGSLIAYGYDEGLDEDQSYTRIYKREGGTYTFLEQVEHDLLGSYDAVDSVTQRGLRMATLSDGYTAIFNHIQHRGLTDTDPDPLTNYYVPTALNSLFVVYYKEGYPTYHGVYETITSGDNEYYFDVTSNRGTSDPLVLHGVKDNITLSEPIGHTTTYATVATFTDVSTGVSELGAAIAMSSNGYSAILHGYTDMAFLSIPNEDIIQKYLSDNVYYVGTADVNGYYPLYSDSGLTTSVNVDDLPGIINDPFPIANNLDATFTRVKYNSTTGYVEEVDETPANYTAIVDPTATTTGDFAQEGGAVGENIVYVSGSASNNSTTGTLTVSISETNRYYIESAEVISYGNKQFQYLDVNGDLQPGAAVYYHLYRAGNGGDFLPTQNSFPGLTVGVDANGRLNSASYSYVPLLWDTDGQDVMFTIEKQFDQYVEPSLSPAQLADVWDLDTEWDTDSYASGKEWPSYNDGVTPRSVKLVYNQPNTTTVAQNGTKYVRNLGFQKWQLEVEYPPLTEEEFGLLHVAAQNARGQQTPFMFINRDQAGNPLVLDYHKAGVTTTARVKDPVSVGDNTILLEGYGSFQTDAVTKGELMTGSYTSNNGDITTMMVGADSNAYGEVKVKLPYGTTDSATASTPAYFSPWSFTVTLSEDSFEYDIDTFGMYYVRVTFDMDEWK